MDNELLPQIISDALATLVVQQVKKESVDVFSMDYLKEIGVYAGSATLYDMFLSAYAFQYVVLNMPEQLQEPGVVLTDLIGVSAIKMVLNKYVLGRMTNMTLKELWYEVMLNFTIMAASNEIRKLLPMPVEETATNNSG